MNTQQRAGVVRPTGWSGATGPAPSWPNPRQRGTASWPSPTRRAAVSHGTKRPSPDTRS